MLRSLSVGPSVLKAYNSRLAVDYLATTVGSIGVPSSANEYALNTAAASSVNHRNISGSLSLQGKLLKLEHANPISFADVKAEMNGGSDQLRRTSKFRSQLQQGQHTKVLIEMLIQSYLNKDYIRDLFKNGELQKSEYATLVNKLLLERDLALKLSNITPDTVHTEILMILFEIYCQYVVEDAEGKLTMMQTHDLNLFVKTFIDEAQLGKAQRCLQYIVEKQGLDYILEVSDVATIKHFLQLRCGALPKYWKVNAASGNPRLSKTKRLGNSSFFCNLSGSYTFLDEESLLKIMNTLFQKATSQQKNSTLDATIVYSLGYLGQMRLIEKFIKNKWLIPKSEASHDISPKPELLIAVLSAYCIQKGDMARGLEVLDSFMEKFPSIDLDRIFWRRLLQLSFQVWDRKEDKKGLINYACWNIMKQWHTRRERSIPYDHGMLSLIYDLFKATKNGKGALDVVSNCFHSFYLRPEQELMPNEYRLLRKFQKLCIKTMADKGNYHKPLQFIKQWSINAANKRELSDCFIKYRQRYEVRQNKTKVRKQSIQKKFDELEEEDMLLGRLW